MREESLLRWTLETINRFEIRPRQRFGQNYVVDHKLIECLVGAAKIGSNDVVLEIGAGIGALTLRLAERAKKVIAVEMDKNAIEALSDVLLARDNVEIVMGDVMAMDLPRVGKVVSNLPFSISTPLTFKLLRDCSFDLAALTYQREVAERLLAKPGDHDYSRLSVVTRLLAEVERVGDFPPEAFYPKPKVFSTVVTVKKRERRDVDWAALEETLKILFSQRRRRLKKAIETYCKIKGTDPVRIFENIGEGFLMRRVFELEPEDFLYINKVIGGRDAKTQADG